MRITVNSKEREVPEGSTLQQLIDELQFGQKRIAVEVNTELVVKAEWDKYVLHPNDPVEIVTFVGGG